MVTMIEVTIFVIIFLFSSESCKSGPHYQLFFMKFSLIKRNSVVNLIWIEQYSRGTPFPDTVSILNTQLVWYLLVLKGMHIFLGGTRIETYMLFRMGFIRMFTIPNGWYVLLSNRQILRHDYGQLSEKSLIIALKSELSWLSEIVIGASEADDLHIPR